MSFSNGARFALGRTVQGGAGDIHVDSAQTMHLKRLQGNAVQAVDACGDKLNQPKEFAHPSRMLLFLLLMLAVRTPLQAQGQEAVFPRTSSYVEFPDDDLVASVTRFCLGDNATATVVHIGQRVFASDWHPSINRNGTCAGGPICDEFPSTQSPNRQLWTAADGDKPAEDTGTGAVVSIAKVKRPDHNLDIYYRNRREFSLDVGWHPVNIPFVYDFAVGDSYNMTPLKYTLVPIIASLRWHVTNVGWRWIFRGNMDFTFSGSITPIPRGPETHYYSFDFGIRRNFVYRNWKAVPYFEQRGGAGIMNAMEPLGVRWAQGQNLTFTYNMGAGIRYNIDSKYSFSAGMNYMHISNGYLSQPAFYNYGINVYGPMFGLDIRLGKPHRSASQ